MLCKKPVRGGTCFMQRGHAGECKRRKSKDDQVIEMSRVYVPGVDADPHTLEEAKARIEYLNGEINMLQKAMEPMGEMRRGFDTMKDDADTIAVFLRENMAKEIERGYHAGRTLGQIVVGYLGELTELRKRCNVAETEVIRLLGNLESIPRSIRRLFGLSV